MDGDSLLAASARNSKLDGARADANSCKAIVAICKLITPFVFFIEVKRHFSITFSQYFPFIERCVCEDDFSFLDTNAQIDYKTTL